MRPRALKEGESLGSRVSRHPAKPRCQAWLLVAPALAAMAGALSLSSPEEPVMLVRQIAPASLDTLGHGVSAVVKSSKTQLAARPAATAATAAPETTADNDRYEIAFPNEAGMPLYDRPGGDVLVRLSAQTIFGTDRALSVVAERGEWLAVVVEELRNGQLGWLPRSQARVGTIREKLVADLSRRELTLERAGKVQMRVPVAIGDGVSPTPIGRFAVSDELVQPYLGGEGEYGCCALVLTGHQYNLPPGWDRERGDRLAIHGTNQPWSIGQPASAGCLRASDQDLRRLMELVPVGTPLVIHP